MKNTLFVMVIYFLLFLGGISAPTDSIEKFLALKNLQMTEYDANNEVDAFQIIYNERPHPCTWLACLCCWGTIGGIAGGAIGLWNTPAVWQCCAHTTSHATVVATTNVVNGCKIGYASCTPAALVLTSPSVARKTNEICKWLCVKGNE